MRDPDPDLDTVLATIEDVKAGRMSLSAAYNRLGEPVVMPLGSTYGVDSDVGPWRELLFDIECRINLHLTVFDKFPRRDGPFSVRVYSCDSWGTGKWKGQFEVLDADGRAVDFAENRFRADYMPGGHRFGRPFLEIHKP